MELPAGWNYLQGPKRPPNHFDPRIGLYPYWGRVVHLESGNNLFLQIFNLSITWQHFFRGSQFLVLRLREGKDCEGKDGAFPSILQITPWITSSSGLSHNNRVQQSLGSIHLVPCPCDHGNRAALEKLRNAKAQACVSINTNASEGTASHPEFPGHSAWVEITMLFLSLHRNVGVSLNMTHSKAYR